MKKVLDVLDRLFHYLAAIGFGCVTVCVLVQILARYIPGVTAPWTDEMTRLFFQYTIMIACPMAIKYHEYASIDVIAAQTHGTGRHILNLVSDAAILIVCLFGIPQGTDLFPCWHKVAFHLSADQPGHLLCGAAGHFYPDCNLRSAGCDQ